MHFMSRAVLLLFFIVASHTSSEGTYFGKREPSLRGGTTKQSTANCQPDCAGDCFVPRNNER